MTHVCTALDVGVDYQSETYLKQPFDCTPTSSTYHEYDGKEWVKGARCLIFQCVPSSSLSCQ